MNKKSSQALTIDLTGNDTWENLRPGQLIKSFEGIQIFYGGKVASQRFFNIKVIKTDLTNTTSRNPIFYTISYNETAQNQINFSTQTQKNDFLNNLRTKFWSEMTYRQTQKIYTDLQVGDGVTLNSDASISFNSSWWTQNSSWSSFVASIRINRNEQINKIKALIPNSKQISSIRITKINYIPVLEIINPPVEKAYYRTTGYSINSDNWISHYQSRQTFNLPEGSDAGSILNLGDLAVAGSWAFGILTALPSAGSSLGVPIIASGLGHANFANRLSSQNNNLKNQLVLNYEMNRENTLKISASVGVYASAGSIFGDRTQTRIKNMKVRVIMAYDTITYRD